jgi:hypothetical protein
LGNYPKLPNNSTLTLIVLGAFSTVRGVSDAGCN